MVLLYMIFDIILAKTSFLEILIRLCGSGWENFCNKIYKYKKNVWNIVLSVFAFIVIGP